MGTDATGFKGEHFDKCNREGSEDVDAMCCKNCAFMKMEKDSEKISRFHISLQLSNYRFFIVKQPRFSSNFQS